MAGQSNIRDSLGLNKRLVSYIIDEAQKAAAESPLDTGNPKAIVCGFIHDLFWWLQQRKMAKALYTLFEGSGPSMDFVLGKNKRLPQKIGQKLGGGRHDAVVVAAALTVDLLRKVGLRQIADRALVLLETLVSDYLAEKESPGKVAFNKFNAPELLQQLVSVLEREGLDYVVAALKQKDVLRLVDRAWKMRGKMAGTIEQEWFKTAAMPEGDFWKMVAKIGWGTKTTDYKAISAAGLNKYHTKKQLDGIRATFDKLKGALEIRLSKWMEDEAPGPEIHSWGTGDDGFDDLCSHIVGLGWKEYQSVMKDPKLAWDRAQKNKYKESFAYALPHNHVLEEQKPKHFVDWAKRSIGEYQTILNDDDLKAFHADTKKLMGLLKLMAANKPEAYYAKSAEATKLAKKLMADWKKVSNRLPRGSVEMVRPWSVENLANDLRYVYFRKTTIKLGSQLVATWFKGAGGWTNLSAGRWSLFSDKKGVGQASKDLNGAMRKAVKTLESEMKKVVLKGNQPYKEEFWAKRLGKVYDKIVYPVMKKHRSFGATDTEPRNHAQQGLIDAVKSFYGISGWTNLGDWM